MSKKMGLSFLNSLSPITSNAWSQISKLGGEGAGRMVAGHVGSGAGIKSWWNGMHLAHGGGGALGWAGIGSKAEIAATMGNRRFTAKAAGALGAMNIFVGDEGFMGFAKSTINTGMALSAGALAWKGSKGLGKVGKFGIRGGALALGGYALGSMAGVF